MGAPTLSLWPSKDVYNTGRAYRHPFTGETLPSVTTVLKLADKSGLTQWAIGLTLDAVNANPDMIYQRSDEDMKKYFKYAWTRVRDERAEVGTGVHEAVEAEHTGQPWPFLDDEQDRIMERFGEFQFMHRVEPEFTEFTVWSAGNFAGTADGLWIIDGVLWLIDVKTSKNTWPEHFAQLGALRHAETALIEVDEDFPNQKAKHTDNKGRVSYWVEIPNPALEAEKVGILHLREDKWELIEVPNADVHKKVFDGYLDVWKAKKELQELDKSGSIKTEKEEG